MPVEEKDAVHAREAAHVPREPQRVHERLHKRRHELREACRKLSCVRRHALLSVRHATEVHRGVGGVL